LSGGLTRRTVQRWEDDGALVPTETIVTLAAALDGVRPDLAAQCRAIASQDPEMPTDPEAITRILEAAAKAAGTSADAVRPAVEAAFREARAVGASVHGVVLALMPGALPSTNQA
jgi:hypothetical protein